MRTLPLATSFLIACTAVLSAGPGTGDSTGSTRNARVAYPMPAEAFERWCRRRE